MNQAGINNDHDFMSRQTGRQADARTEDIQQDNIMICYVILTENISASHSSNLLSLQLSSIIHIVFIAIIIYGIEVITRERKGSWF